MAAVAWLFAVCTMMDSGAGVVWGCGPWVVLRGEMVPSYIRSVLEVGEHAVDV